MNVIVMVYGGITIWQPCRFDPVILGTSVVIFRTTLSLIEATNPQTLSLVMVVWWCGGVVVVV